METNTMEADCILGLVKFKRIYKNKTLHSKMYKYKTPFQLRVLWSVFTITSYPTSRTRESLAILLNISIRSVQIWFQNARQSRRGSYRKNIIRKNNLFMDVNSRSLLHIYFREM